MLSILIPTYNYSVFPLVDMLQKEANTLQVDFEILVLDDGSTNDEIFASNTEIENLFNSRFIKNEENLGRTETRQRLAQMAAYENLLFLDADVIPKNQFFIKHYIEVLAQTGADVIFGGITYEMEKPEINKMLRWKYGKEREAKSVKEREKDPFFIISQNLFIKKSVFLKANLLIENYYGLDNFFSNQLKKMNAQVLHIDNPVTHFGLEENEKFIKKALKAVETTVILEKKGLMDNDMRPIQKSYLKLQKYHLRDSFSYIVSKLKNRMEHNFFSDNPNLFWFDLYRLNYYIQLKNPKNA